MNFLAAQYLRIWWKWKDVLGVGEGLDMLWVRPMGFKNDISVRTNEIQLALTVATQVWTLSSTRTAMYRPGWSCLRKHPTSSKTPTRCPCSTQLRCRSGAMQPQGTPGCTSPFSYQHFQLHFSGVCYAQPNTGPWGVLYKWKAQHVGNPFLTLI